MSWIIPSGVSDTHVRRDFEQQAMSYGVKYEGRAIRCMEKHIGQSIYRVPSLIAHGIKGRPDGITEDGGALVEVKCPFTLLHVTGHMNDYYAKKGQWGLIRNGALNTARNTQARKYYRQCQLYLKQRPNIPILHFGIWGPKAEPQILVIDILPDAQWLLKHNHHGIKAKSTNKGSVRSSEKKKRDQCLTQAKKKRVQKSNRGMAATSHGQKEKGGKKKGRK